MKPTDPGETPPTHLDALRKAETSTSPSPVSVKENLGNEAPVSSKAGDAPPQNTPDTYPCHWCESGVHDLTREIEAIRNEGRCSVSMMQRRFRYGYAHALEVCRQLEARDWLRIVAGGKCELSGKILLSEHSNAAGAPPIKPKDDPPASPVSLHTDEEGKALGEKRRM